MAEQPRQLELPAPPPFMWSCPECADGLDDLGDALEVAVTDPFYEGVLRVQITLARHLADEHPDVLPKPHDDGCESCARFERLGTDITFWREHLARGLFLPDEVARLM
ncbi:MAG: hypothetical protein HOV82_16950 [Streptomyces sp.]|nr:hypothetical protein [Streptomyces sp.]NUS75568.1 hypothetical protein [Streptomyces sp.]